MIFDWYKIFKLSEFLDTDLVSRTYNPILAGIGQVQILVTTGNSVNLLYEGVLLPVQFQDKNPFIILPYAVYLDDNGDVWLGIEATP